MNLLVGALPTIVFGVFTIVFTQQQNAASQAAREQDQRQADENNQRILFKQYIDDIKELLLLVDGLKMKIETLLIHVRVRTLTVLKSLDASRKHDIILFLYESGLLDHVGDRAVDLRGANLNGVRFEKSSTEACDLDQLFLPGVFGEGIVFDGCAMTHAVFNNAAMPGAIFSSCMLDSASFSKANLKGARFHENMLSTSSFYGSDLSRSHIRGSFFAGVDLSNTDLYQSDIHPNFVSTMNLSSLISPSSLLLVSRQHHGAVVQWTDADFTEWHKLLKHVTTAERYQPRLSFLREVRVSSHC